MKGLSFSGKDLDKKQLLVLQLPLIPMSAQLKKPLNGLRKKFNYGADYFISQPVFSEEKLIEVYENTKHLNAPIYIGLMPLTSSKKCRISS